jgi:hypothetical protein
MVDDKNKFICRVCGKLQGDPPWGEDGKCPTHNICDCCGVEFGYEDCNISAIRAFRIRWLANGGQWWSRKKRPADWSLEEQMKNIPEEYL